MAEKLYAGEIPESILDKEIEKFHAKRKAAGGKKLPDGDAQFKYNNNTYTLKLNSNHKKGVQVVPAWREARDAATRIGRKKSQEIKLSSIEQMMVDNYYKEGQARGLQVDHDFPIDKGGPSNAPWNLKLRTKEVNLAKGNKLGGHWPSEPFLGTSLNNDNSPLVSTVQRDKTVPTTNGPKTDLSSVAPKSKPKFDNLAKVTNPKQVFNEVSKVGGKKLLREVVRKMGGSNNVLANISGDLIGVTMDGISYAQTRDNKRLADLCLSGGQAMTTLAALGVACLPVPGARPGAFMLIKAGDNIAQVERLYNIFGGMDTVHQLMENSHNNASTNNLRRKRIRHPKTH